MEIGVLIYFLPPPSYVSPSSLCLFNCPVGKREILMEEANTNVRILSVCVFEDLCSWKLHVVEAQIA